MKRVRLVERWEDVWRGGGVVVELEAGRYAVERGEERVELVIEDGMGERLCVVVQGGMAVVLREGE